MLELQICVLPPGFVVISMWPKSSTEKPLQWLQNISKAGRLGRASHPFWLVWSYHRHFWEGPVDKSHILCMGQWWEPLGKSFLLNLTDCLIMLWDYILLPFPVYVVLRLRGQSPMWPWHPAMILTHGSHHWGSSHTGQGGIFSLEVRTSLGGRSESKLLVCSVPY